MFYETSKNDHGLPYNPFKAIVAPRPIGWISSIDAQGRVNLAPYSFFNGLGDKPPMVMFSSTGYKDSVRNAEETGEFVCNLVSYDLRDEMNLTSASLAPGESEFDHAGLEMASCNLVKAPRVARAPAAMECKLLQCLRMKDVKGEETDVWVTLGQVVGIHIDESYLVDGCLDAGKMRPLSRLGYKDYATVESVFSLNRPVPKS